MPHLLSWIQSDIVVAAQVCENCHSQPSGNSKWSIKSKKSKSINHLIDQLNQSMDIIENHNEYDLWYINWYINVWIKIKD